MGAVYARGAQYGPAQVGLGLEPGLGLDLGEAVACVGGGDGIGGEGCIAFLVAGAQGAEGAHVEEAFEQEGGIAQLGDEGAHVFKVDAVEVGETRTLGGSQVPHHVVPSSLGSLAAQGGGYGLGVVVVEVDDMQAGEVEPAAGCGRAHSGPGVVAQTDGAASDEASDEASGAHYEQCFFHSADRFATKIQKTLQSSEKIVTLQRKAPGWRNW